MTHTIAHPIVVQRRRGRKLAIGTGLVMTALASGAMLATSASAAVATPSSAVTVVADGDADSPARRSIQKEKGNLPSYVIPHTIVKPKYPAPPVCEKKPYLPNCGPQW
ncbi:hypothetical protein [Streptomyces bambusae]|uniref:Uncharacterized protein n=1 Tax=Streptomyces bambusae TaxID=1550616 RepID=A0ABS6Z604_9ACTN|nr:hypothetical protein [Streptomyces bambusae]MBW5483195.1 hypothetical protein [Streptomyces bambusae]